METVATQPELMRARLARSNHAFFPPGITFTPLLSQFRVVLKPGDTLRWFLQPQNKIPLGSPWDDMETGTGFVLRL